MKNILLFILFFISVNGLSQVHQDSLEEEISLLFIGDIMGHSPQITSAYDKSTKTYDYNSCFQYIKEEINAPDYAFGNLEVTLAGPVYKGYPQFSSPDNLALACKNAGIDVLVTANNHSCDRGGAGIVRTISVLDSFKIMHTGTFKDSVERSENYPFIIESNCFRLAILNYTYGTNGLPYPAPTIVNVIDKDLIKKDIERAKSKNVDKIIVITHWGSEYKRDPVQSQIDMGQYIFDQGADIIIGGHSHVVEKMVWEKQKTENDKERLIVYSLGNFVSNQRKPRTDGGAMFKMTLVKKNGITNIKSTGYILTWVYTPIIDGKKKYYILPASKYENNPEFFDNSESYNKMIAFIKGSRDLFNEQNQNVPEYIYQNEKWILSK